MCSPFLRALFSRLQLKALRRRFGGRADVTRGGIMKRECVAVGFWFAVVVHPPEAPGQVQGSVESHVSAARAAAGKEHTFLFQLLCTASQALTATPPVAPAPAGPPTRESWHAEPAKV